MRTMTLVLAFYDIFWYNEITYMYKQLHTTPAARSELCHG